MDDRADGLSLATVRHLITGAMAQGAPPVTGEQILNLMPAGVYACDAQGRITFFNRRAAELWGREPRVGEDKWCAAHRAYLGDGTLAGAESLPMARTMQDRCVLRGIELTFERADRSRLEVSFNIDPLCTPDGKITGAIAVFQDITDRKRRERHEALLTRLSDQLVRLTLEPEILALTTRLLGEHVRANRCYAAEVDEARRDATILDDWTATNERRLRGAFRTTDFGPPEFWQAAVTGPLGIPDVTVHSLTRGCSGAYQAFSIRACATFACSSPHGRTFVLAVTSDQPRAWTVDEMRLVEHVAQRVRPQIERARAEAATHDTLRRLRIALKAGRLGDWTWDAATNTITLSGVPAEIIGIPSGTRLERAVFRSYVHPEDIEDAREIVQQAMDARSDYQMEYRLRRPDGTYAWLEVQGMGLYTPAGTLASVIGVMQEITGRKAAEAQLQKHERELRLIGEHAPAVLSHWDREHRLVFASRAFASRWGVPADRLLGKTVSEVLGVEAFDTLRPHVERVLRGETTEFEMEVPYDGIGTRYVRASYAPEFGPDGTVRGYLAAVLDLTERRRSEMALVASEERLRMATQTGKVGVWDWDLGANRVTWTESLYAIHGVTPAEFDGSVEKFAQVVHPNDRAPVERAVRSALEHDSHFELEFRAVRPGGGVIWLFTNATVVREQGRAVRILGATLDVTARKAAELALRESETRFRTLASHAPVGIFLTDLHGDTIVVNEAWTSMVGLGADEARGRRWAEAVHPDDRAEVVATWDAAVRDGRSVNAEYRFLQRDGRTTWVQGIAVPLRDPNGRATGYIGTIADVTQRKLAEDKLRAHEAEMRRELEREVNERTASLRNAIAQMEEFSYSVSHDLRAPLRAMNAYAQALVEDYGPQLDATAREYLDRIQRSSRRMENLTHDVLNYSRVARTDLQLSATDLETLLRDLISQYAELQPAHADFEIIGPLGKVRGHESSLGQVFANLLTNAAKFVAPGARPNIRVHAEPAGERVRVWIADNGIGIPPEFQAGLFHVFARVPTEHAYEGTGIGLAIVRKAIEKMDGRCGVESNGKNGSRFWIELHPA